MGIKKDLNLEGDQYQWLGSLFYFGMSHLCFSPLEFILSLEALSLMALPHRLSRLGIPNQPPPPAPPTREILRSMHLNLGIDSQLLCRCQQLPRCYRYPLYAWCFRSRRDAGLCTLNFPGMDTTHFSL